MHPIIEVSGLNKEYPGVKAVNNLSFTVHEGDIYGFLGQNGAGKSTSIRMLLTLIKPTGGSIRIFGKDLVQNRHDILSQTGAIIEKPDLYKYLSAFDNLSIFARMSGNPLKRSQLMEKLEMVGLAERSDSDVKTFSQGMKQRLGIAVALVHDPKLIILDEPTNGLDPQGIADMRNLIIRLSRDMHKTVVVSSHLLSEVEQMANRMLIIDKGQKVAEGYVKELLSPANSIVTVDTTDNTATYSYFESKFPEWQPALSGSVIRLRMDKAKIPALVSSLVHANVNVISVQPRHSLEDYFLSLTNPAQHVEPVAN